MDGNPGARRQESQSGEGSPGLEQSGKAPWRQSLAAGEYGGRAQVWQRAGMSAVTGGRGDHLATVAC